MTIYSLIKTLALPFDCEEVVILITKRDNDNMATDFAKIPIRRSSPKIDGYRPTILHVEWSDILDAKWVEEFRCDDLFKKEKHEI